MPFLEVQLPTGHRDKIEITNNSLLISVLDEICYKRSLNIDNCSLLYNKAKIDLSVKFGQSKLINNSKLELVISPTSLIDNITLEITLQLPSGARVTNTFVPRDSLWSVLMKSIKDSEYEHDPMVFGPNSNLVPVFIYLHDQIVGQYCLQNTSLASLGFRYGRVLFRLDLKELSSDHLQMIDDFKKKRAKYSQNQENKSTSKDSQTEIPNESVVTLVDPPYQDHVAPDFTMTKEYESFNDFSPFSTFPSNQKFFDDPPDNQKKTEHHIKRSTTLGELLGISLDADDTSYTAINAPYLADFKFPEESAGQNLMELDEKPIEKVLMANAERESVFYYRKPTEQLILDEIPNSFYEITEQDFRHIIKSYRQAAETDAPLLTKALKEQMREANFSKYERCIIQFHFQDAYILQSVFKPKETIGDLYNYVKLYLRSSHENFQLYTTPPKEILKDKESTLIKNGLVPLSKIYVSIKAAELCPENLDPFITVDAEDKANELLSKWMKTDMNNQEVGQTQNDPSMICGTSSSNKQVPRNSKLPKWFNR